MSAFVCAVGEHRCGREGPVQLHHVLGRGADGAYIEPIILLPLCQPDCHQRGIHELLRAEHLDGRRSATDGLLVSRVGATCGYLGGNGQGVVTVPAAFFCGLARHLWPLGRRLMAEEGCRG